MTDEPRRFASLAEAIATLRKERSPMVLTRFSLDPVADVVIAANRASAKTGYAPVPGEHPDRRRDQRLTAEIELNYLYRHLVERGHARQVLAIDDGRLMELTVTRVDIAGDAAVYGFVRPKPVRK